MNYVKGIESIYAEYRIWVKFCFALYREVMLPAYILFSRGSYTMLVSQAYISFAEEDVGGVNTRALLMGVTLLVARPTQSKKEGHAARRRRQRQIAVDNKNMSVQ